MLKTLKTQKGFTLVEILVVVIIVAILAAIAVPVYMQYVEKAKSTEAQSAISAIRTAYNIHYQAHGTTDNYDIDKALKDARVGLSTTKNWRFEVVGNPPQRYVATSTNEFSSGEGKVVYYDVDQAKYHGFGIDDEVDETNL
ncbi:MAG: prepilin-type N-terminal cleavage/methylation domain-containing protein [Candidatus Cloacimonetes bacterium]|nr:prepilin-type N-terminal cleavage/methylation domain-containing protein [Candidatus Cloacimonadota bacterium]